MAKKDLQAEKQHAEARRTDAQIDQIQAKARAEAATKDMQAASGMREKFDEVKRKVKADVEEKRTKFEAWDAARERQFNARLDLADAKLREWKASADIKRAEQGMKEHDAFAHLEESAALARARLADWNAARHERKSQEALQNAERNFEKAFDAAMSRYKQ